MAQGKVIRIYSDSFRCVEYNWNTKTVYRPTQHTVIQ